MQQTQIIKDITSSKRIVRISAWAILVIFVSAYLGADILMKKFALTSNFLSLIFVTSLAGILIVWLKWLKPSLETIENFLLNEHRLVLEKTHALEMSQNSNHELSVLLDNAPGMIASINKHFRFEYANKAYLENFGLTNRQQIVGKHIKEVLGAACWGKLEPTVTQVMSGKSMSHQVGMASQTGIRHVHANYVPEVSEGGEINRFFALVVDTHERHLAEKALLENKQDLNTTLNAIGEGVAVTNANGIVTKLNPVGQSILGVSSDTAIGKPLTDLLEFRRIKDGVTVNPLIKVFSKKKIVRSPAQIDLHAPSGHTCSAGYTAAPILDEKNQLSGAILVFKDTSWETNTRSQLARADKLRALDQLVGGIAHDFNNLLAGISGAAELLQVRESKNIHPDNLKYLARISQQVDRSVSLTDKLTAISKQSNADRSEVGISELLKEVADVLRETSAKHLAIKIKDNTTNDIVFGAHGLLHSAILNLCINAVQAVDSNGKILISINSTTIDRKRAKQWPAFPLEPGEYVEIKIKDNGIGISPQNLSKIFEPFYTTKEEGEGTGLGLSAVYGVVKEHHGMIEVESKLEKGSVFTIRLPAWSAQEVPSIAPDQSVFQDNIDIGKILIVDDEEPIRQSISEMLEQMGYNTVLAEDGYAALNAIKEHGRAIGFVILDVNMPQLNGLDTYKQLNWPDRSERVVLMTGNMNSKEMNALRELGATKFMKKPFRLDAIRDMISLPVNGQQQPVQTHYIQPKKAV